MSEFQLPVSKVAVKFHFSLSTLVVAAPKISIRLIYSEILITRRLYLHTEICTSRSRSLFRLQLHHAAFPTS